MLPDGMWWGLAGGALYVAVLVWLAAWVSLRKKPTAAIAWILALVFMPVIGVVLFAVLGNHKLPRRRRDIQASVNESIRARTEGVGALSHSADWPDWLAGVVRLNAELGALPMVGGNATRIVTDYEDSIAQMAEAVDAATDFVHVEFYLLVLDETTRPFFEALGRAVARGVTVRVLLDHLTSVMNPGRSETTAYLDEIAAQWQDMLPLRPWRGQWRRPDLRNHRKLLVVDDRVGFTGSQNMVDATYNKKSNLRRGLRWHDLMIRVEGPAVRALDAVFASDWYAETREALEIDTSPIAVSDTPEAHDAQVVPSGPSFDNENNLKLYVTLLHLAQRRISITSPYFVPEETVVLALVTAANRGVAVELFVSEIGDQWLVYHAQRSYYEVLLRAGVRIHLYRAPAVLHSKHFSIDEDVAVIGSSNMDIRSFQLNMEVSVLVHGHDVVERLRRVENDYRTRSRPLELADWVARPRRQKVRDGLARLTSALQ